MSAPTSQAADRERPDPNGSFSLAEIGLEAERRLRGSAYSSLRDISCTVQGDLVRLSGRLPTYFLKQVAQAIVAEVGGVRRVVNQIDVVAPPGRPPIGRERTEPEEESIR